MKVTRLKDVETYLYTSIVLPLKGLNTVEIDYPSPISGKDGEPWVFHLRRAPLQAQRLPRQYQRERAQRNRDWEIYLNIGQRRIHVGDYDIRSHVVRLYESPFKEMKAMILFGKLHQVFMENTPFSKVITETFPPRPRGRRFVNPFGAPENDAPEMATPYYPADQGLHRETEVPF